MTLAPNDPRHGTINGYANHRCRCPLCRDARRAYGIERGELTGTAKRPTGSDAARINSQPAAAHVRRLLADGASLTAIARVAGCSYGAVQAIAAGTAQQITRATADRLAAVTIEKCRSISTGRSGSTQPPGDWIRDGACHGRIDLLDLFFPLPSTPRSETDKARAVCARCPAIDACADYIAANPQQGVWAGTTEADRNHGRRRGAA